MAFVIEKYMATTTHSEVRFTFEGFFSTVGGRKLKAPREKRIIFEFKKVVGFPLCIFRMCYGY